MRLYQDGQAEDPKRCRVQVHPADKAWHQCLIVHKRGSTLCSDHETRLIQGYATDIPEDAPANAAQKG
jgi:hypothetical protein